MVSDIDCAAVSEESSEEPRIEKPEIEEPRIEEPRIEEHRIEEPRIEEPRIEEPRIEEPRIEEPRIEEPRGDWKYTLIYYPQRRLRVLVERCRKDSSHLVHQRTRWFELTIFGSGDTSVHEIDDWYGKESCLLLVVEEFIAYPLPREEIHFLLVVRPFEQYLQLIYTSSVCLSVVGTLHH
ncbi:hypothetical protein TNCV_4221451 [Trichonephila clavipes]|nr:hypothetical protein TNCV_4221451 [Trichonephila clavipes]